MSWWVIKFNFLRHCDTVPDRKEFIRLSSDGVTPIPAVNYHPPSVDRINLNGLTGALVKSQVNGVY